MKRPLLKLISVFIVLIIIAVALGYGYWYLTTTYEVKNVYVEGNVHYSSDEIRNMVLTGKWGSNSLWLDHEYKNKAIEDVPFVETMDVEVLSPDTIKIIVFEKALAGYVEYLGKYVYFDKDGIVVEVSSMKTQGIPQVIGVDFDYVILHEALPVDNPDLFKAVLNITKLMTKYKVEAEKLYFKSNGETVLYHNKVIIRLGNDENLDLKIMNLPSLLENLEGMSGTLRMDKYDENTKKITFEPAKDSEP